VQHCVSGQGYVWLAHRDPSNVAWKLASRSKQLWEEFVSQDGSAAESLTEWEQTGSLLLARTEAEADQLKTRVDCLRNVGIDASWLDFTALQKLEPALDLPTTGAGLLVPTDAQINGKVAAFHLLDRLHATSPTFQCLLGEAAEEIVMEPSGTGRRVVGVQTSKRKVTVSKGIVVAAGAWTGAWLASALDNPLWEGTIVPRRGLLLELDMPAGMPPIKHGMMEVSYTKHYTKPGRDSGKIGAVCSDDEDELDITFTATRSASGKLLVGSSREFCGWDKEESCTATAHKILEHAAKFLSNVTPELLAHPSMNIRVGHRPLAARGLPLVGPVAGLEGLWLASGHEGSGLTLGMATGELITWHILGEEQSQLPAEMGDVALALMPPVSDYRSHK
jgi:glycine/D-amino acid oxidase-like deaminating enzyme